MKTKLMTDASCLLPLEIMKKENIAVLESLLLIGDKEYRELTEINREEFINSLPTIEPYPTTSQAGAQDALDLYQKAVDEGYDEILYLGVTPSLSSQMNIARLAAKRFKDKIKITVYSTELACGSQGALVNYASHLLKSGKSSEEIISILDTVKEKIYTLGIAVNMTAVFKTGRVKRGSAKGIIASLLKMKPIIEFNIKDGFIGIGAETSFKSAFKTMIKEIEEKTEPDITYDLFLADALNSELMNMYADEIKKIRKIGKVHLWEMTPVMALSSGKGAVIATLCPSITE
ncbi:MAG: DegV family EDD domain-containing protein [Candidatus Heimdallarchaeota archaeon]|nr:DegV family EDD domain-containing protein [Candidatus Heimdallarchaeota archaeon]MCK4771149.1 DegV family EDD domain-containing protein [Candidatus Heimdallarchaeota archaeon]